MAREVHTDPLAQPYDSAAHGITTGEKVAWAGAGAFAAAPAAYSFWRLGNVLPRAAGMLELAAAEVELFAPLLAL